MISKEYHDALREKVISEFIRINRRSPNVTETQQLIKNAEKEYYAIDEVGFSGYDLIKPKFREQSSITSENSNRESLYNDFMILNRKLDHLIDIEESAYRGAASTLARSSKSLSELNDRLDNLLLIYGKDDLFLYGIEENFSSQSYIDLDRTTATVEPSCVTLGKTRLETVDLSSARIVVTPLAEKGYISYEANSAIDTLKENDGSIWRGAIKTNYQLGRVSLLMEITFPEIVDLSSLKLYGLPVENNQIVTCTVFYSTNGSVFNSIEPIERRLESNFICPINIAGVKKIQILFSKSAADADLGGNEYEYLYLFDKISFERSSFTQDTLSTLWTKAYPVINTDGDPVYFSKATLTACTNVPSGSSVAFYISDDGSTYWPIDHTGSTSNFVSFGDHTPTQSIDFFDSTKSGNIIIDQLNLTEDVDLATEGYLNTYITESFAEKVPYRSITVRRNYASYDSPSIVLGTEPGWLFDVQKGTYSTVIYIANPEGRHVDFGPNGININGRTVSGEVWLKTGYSNVIINSSNWIAIPSSLVSQTELVAQDPLYPFNHKYLIQGYNYPGTYTGDKIYSGADEYFARLLHYISIEQFESAKNNYNVFTVEEVDDKLFIKVKVDKTSSTWQSELFELDFIVQNSESNNIFVKAVLNSNSLALTPILESFKVRVV